MPTKEGSKLGKHSVQCSHAQQQGAQASPCATRGYPRHVLCEALPHIQKQKHDRELQQVLSEVENTANDALQFKAWKLSVESQFSLGIKGQPLAARPKSGQN